MLFFEYEKDIFGGKVMKGYTVAEGYMGFVDGRYMLFASEADYEDYMNL